MSEFADQELPTSSPTLIGRGRRASRAAVSGSGTIEGIDGGRADVSVAIVRLGRSKLYAGSVRIDDPGAGPPSFTWEGLILGTVKPTGPGTVEGVALARSATRPIGPYLLKWSVTDASAR